MAGTSDSGFMRSTAAEKLVVLLNDKRMAREVGEVLAQTATELADAYAARDHFKRSVQMVLDEMEALAKIVLNSRSDKRLVVRISELNAIPSDLILHVGILEPGVRVYELRRREDTRQPDAKQMVLPEGHA